MTTQSTDRKNRLEECTRLIEEATKCLENNDKQRVMKLIEELIRNQCHSGYVVGREIANKVKDVVHELWLRVRDNDELICELLSMLKRLGMSRGWIRETLVLNSRGLNKRLVKCGMDWESRTTRDNIVKRIEDLLRGRLGWDEVKTCEELWRFVGVDVNEFRKYGIEPCVWLNGLETLNDLRNPYWLGLRASDLAVRRHGNAIGLVLRTSNSISALFFPKILSIIKTPSLEIEWDTGRLTIKYVSKPIILSYRIDLSVNTWPWPIKLDIDVLERILNGFSNEELAMFIAGLIDGDGIVYYKFEVKEVIVEVAVCKNCPKRFIPSVLKKVIAERFGIVGNDYSDEKTILLSFNGKNAIKLLKRIMKYMHHPLRRLRAELILTLYDGRISPEEFERLYEQIKYKLGEPDIKHNHGLEALIRAAPQTHTHGEMGLSTHHIVTGLFALTVRHHVNYLTLSGTTSTILYRLNRILLLSSQYQPQPVVFHVPCLFS
jgi:hypothetical protein